MSKGFHKDIKDDSVIKKQKVREVIDEVISQNYPQGIILNHELKKRLKL